MTAHALALYDADETAPPARPGRVSPLVRVPTAVEPVQVPVVDLLPADSPRLNGADPERVAELSATEGPQPPILVDRRTMRVIDGMHRLLAAVAAGHATIAVEYFDGSAADAFLRAVEANLTHGLPLSREDRHAAARRIVQSHPHLSDRSIADVTGLSAKTVAVIRRCLDDPSVRPASRLGRDGKLHPVDKNAGRHRAAALFSANPDASLREIARRAGISPATASDVRRRMVSGEPIVNAESATAGAPAAQPTVRLRLAPPPARRPDPADVLANLVRDPSLRTRDDGRHLLHLLHRTASEKQHLAVLASTVPAHCVEAVDALARNYAEMWMEFAEALG